MAESMVDDTPKYEIEAEEPAASEKILEVSISFGRFESDSLSWERWSSFSHNKYLEEVEKCSTPGSVAQKKAYFEAHYKKIAARKAELLEEEGKTEADFFRSDESSSEDLINNGCEINTGLDSSNFETIPEAKDPEIKSVSEVCSNHVNECDERNTDSEVAIEYQGASDEVNQEELNCRSDSPKSNKLEVFYGESEEMAKEELNSRPDSPKSNKSEVDIEVKEENNSMESRAQVEPLLQLGNETGKTLENKVEEVKLSQTKESQKRTPTAKEKNSARTKKKPASPTPKSPQISTSRVSKPTTPTTAITGYRTPARKESNLSLQRSSNSSTVERKRSTPIPMHMSLSLGPSKSDSFSLNTPRRSFIMEKMGDKEIVKRAFKTFQNSFNQLRTDKSNSSFPQQVSVTTSTPQRDKDRTKKTLEKVSAQKGQVGARGNSISARPLKAAGVNQNSAKASPSPSFGLRSDERAEKRREFLKKLEEKSSAKEVEKTHLQSKSKEQKEAEIRKLRQSLNFKATPMPEFYKGQKISKANINKGTVNNGIHHQP